MFETKQVKKTGEEEETITIFSDKASEELKDSVREAHQKSLPSDWVFGIYADILDSLSNYDIEKLEDIDDIRGEIVDSLVNIYTYDLTDWLHSNNTNIYYLEEAQKEFGPIEDGFKLLSTAQYIAIDEIFSYVYDLLK